MQHYQTFSYPAFSRVSRGVTYSINIVLCCVLCPHDFENTTLYMNNKRPTNYEMKCELQMGFCS